MFETEDYILMIKRSLDIYNKLEEFTSIPCDLELENSVYKFCGRTTPATNKSYAIKKIYRVF